MLKTFGREKHSLSKRLFRRNKGNFSKTKCLKFLKCLFQNQSSKSTFSSDTSLFFVTKHYEVAKVFVFTIVDYCTHETMEKYRNGIKHLKINVNISSAEVCSVAKILIFNFADIHARKNAPKLFRNSTKHSKPDICYFGFLGVFWLYERWALCFALKSC